MQRAVVISLRCLAQKSPNIAVNRVADASPLLLLGEYLRGFKHVPLKLQANLTPREVGMVTELDLLPDLDVLNLLRDWITL